MPTQLGSEREALAAQAAKLVAVQTEATQFLPRSRLRAVVAAVKATRARRVALAALVVVVGQVTRRERAGPKVLVQQGKEMMVALPPTGPLDLAYLAKAVAVVARGALVLTASLTATQGVTAGTVRLVLSLDLLLPTRVAVAAAAT